MQRPTIATILSVSRILLVIPLWYCLTGSFENNRLWAAGIVAVGIATDFFDGFVARRLHQVSELGKILDPIADKISVGFLAVMLVWQSDLPLWFLLFMVMRDILILLGGLYIKRKNNIIVQSNWPGKIAVTIIALALFLATLRLEEVETAKWVAIWASIFMMTLSLVLYTQRLFIGRSVERRP